MSRQSAREIVFKLVYEFNVNGEPDPFSLKILSGNELEEDVSFITGCYNGIVEKAAELRAIIARFSKDFDIDRIYKTDLAALMLAIYEIYYRDDIPDKVSANEATELAKTYSSEKSYSFVNGILAAVIKEKEENAGKNN